MIRCFVDFLFKLPDSGTISLCLIISEIELSNQIDH
jgi:hypothetical protein